MAKKIMRDLADERYQIPFRYDGNDIKLINELKREWGEATVSKVLKRALREAKEFKLFKEKIRNAIKKEYKIDPKTIREVFGSQFDWIT